MLLRRMVQISVCAALAVAWLPSANAQRNSCATAWRNAETLFKKGQLRDSKESMLKCAVAACGARLRQECAQRVAEIEADIPTIVPVVKDSDGDPVTEVQLAMDGEVVAGKIDGRAVMVDPGPHEFTFQSGRRVLASYKTVVLRGQRNRTVEVTMGSWGQDAVVRTRVPSGSLAASMKGARTPDFRLEFDEEPSSGSRFTTGTYVLAGVGVLGVAGYGLTSLQGNREIEACTPMCSPARVDRVKKMYLAGKIALGVGAAALLGAAYLFFTSDSGSSEMAMGSSSGFRLDVLPTAAGGGFAGLSGSF